MIRNKAIIYLTIASLLWGATAPIMKLTLNQVPMFSLIVIRMTFAAIIMYFLFGKSLKVSPKDIKEFFFAAIFGVTLNLSLFFTGLKLTHAINASFLVATVPVFTLIAAHFALREKFTLKLVISSLLALLGVAIIIGRPDGTLTLKNLLGNILLLLATASWVVHEIISKKLLKKYPGETVAFVAMAIGGLIFLPLALWETLTNPTWIQNLNSQSILGILYGIGFSSLLAYWVWQKGLSLLPAGEASFFFYLDPVSGAALSILLLGEKITPALIAGGVLILSAVILAEHKRKAHPLHRV